jgi:hypothetical protein
MRERGFNVIAEEIDDNQVDFAICSDEGWPKNVNPESTGLPACPGCGKRIRPVDAYFGGCIDCRRAKFDRENPNRESE